MGTVRGIVTLLLMLSFVGMTLWLFLSKRRFESAAELPLEDDAHADQIRHESNP